MPSLEEPSFRITNTGLKIDITTPKALLPCVKCWHYFILFLNCEISLGKISKKEAMFF
jgi:hypothetical protein